jgi:hypothetical protein
MSITETHPPFTPVRPPAGQERWREGFYGEESFLNLDDASVIGA